MAIMFLNVRSVSRAAGASAVAKAAYIARDRLPDARAGVVRDYRHVPGLQHAEILLPTARPLGSDWAQDRTTLWNRAESAERQRNSRVAREYTVALPHELSPAARLALAQEFAQGIADRYRTPVDLAVHGPTPHGDARNHHAHVLATTRELGADGLGRKSAIELGSRERRALGLQHVALEFRALRAQWAELANQKLREANLEARLEPRSRETIAREEFRRARAAAAAPSRAGESPIAPAAAPRPATEARSEMPRPGERLTALEAAQQGAVEKWLAYRAGADSGAAARPERERGRERGHDAGHEF